jgi:CMP-N,N'-diacetyllegionaminic acid synthase
MTELVAVITARGGSKRLPGKNIKTLAGKPLIAWTIDAALNSSGVNRVVVSTDDDKIAFVSRMWDAEVPFMRPQELATDSAKSIDVVIHAIKKLNLKKSDDILLLQPTSPLRTSEDINDAISIMRNRHADAVVSVTAIPKMAHDYITQKIDENGILSEAAHSLGEYFNPDFPARYMWNGAIYLNRVESILKDKTFRPEDRTYALEMPKERSIDIDTELDFKIAECIIRNFLHR